ncbi:hypothetical protein B296_00004419 [Ensete ventricosum]|uniref:Uncharacterized protein n=1 Tax=Ensete ventricosum TaxID=4639 RepID=A0A427AYK7_ENSVE|nr:hypothetical protein B296_00004419 [Ensete ventricosum]
MYVTALSSSYCSRTLAATDATCSHEVTPQSQPTLLLPSSSSTIATAFQLRSLGCHLLTNIRHLKNHNLDDIIASTLQHYRRIATDTTAAIFFLHRCCYSWLPSSTWRLDLRNPDIIAIATFNLKIEEVKAPQPYTLKAAISFARHEEERLNYEARKTRVTPRLVTLKLSPPPTISRPPQPQKLIREDLHDGSTKGLCGCCDKIWSLEHKCKKETPLMIVPTEEPKLEDTTLKPKEKDTPQSATHMVPTLVGYTNLQKLKIEGFLEQQSIIILIDAVSTHNFMSSKVAAHLMLQKEDYNGFNVKVANGQILKCN